MGKQDRVFDDYVRKMGNGAVPSARKEYRLAAKDRSSLMVSRKTLTAVKVYAQANRITVAEATQRLLAIAFLEVLKLKK